MTKPAMKVILYEGMSLGYMPYRTCEVGLMLKQIARRHIHDP